MALFKVGKKGDIQGLPSLSRGTGGERGITESQ